MRYVLVLLVLAGCATPEQRAERIMAVFGPMCDKLGFQRDTDPWRNCVLQQAGAQQQSGAALYGAMQQSRPRTCTTVGATTQCY